MKAYVYREPGTAWGLEDVPDPVPGPQDVVIEVAAAGVCGSDLNYRYGRTRPKIVPLVPGHEIAGTIVEVGDCARGIAVGDRVCVHYVVSCGCCIRCDRGFDNRCRKRRSVGAHLNGGFAEYLAVPDRNAFKLPDTMPMEQGAIVGCAVTTAYHAVKLARLRNAETVVVFGLGGVGMHAVEWAKFLGAGIVVGVDVDEAKLEMAPRFGADLALHAERDDVVGRIHTLTEQYGADIALECAGHSACMKMALACVHGKSAYESGRLMSVAVCLDEFVVPEGSQFREGAFIRPGDHTRDELRAVLRLVERGSLDLARSVTHTFPFSELERAMETIESRREKVLRAVLTFADPPTRSGRQVLV